MSASWTVYARDVECGAAAGSHPIPAGQPVRVIGSAILRCAEHAHVPVDETAIDAARHRLEVLREQQARPQSTPKPGLRIRPTRPKSFASLGDIGVRFDPKAAAAGDRRHE